VLLLERLQASTHLELWRPALLVTVQPLGWGQVRPADTRGEIRSVVADNAEECIVGFTNRTVQVPHKDPDNVRVDQAPNPRFALCKIAIQPGVLERGRGLRCKQLQYRDTCGSEDTGGQVVFKVEHPDE